MTDTSLLPFGSNVHATRTSLVFDNGVDRAEWLEIGSKLRQIEGAVHFWIGDWLNYGEAAWGEMYTQALEETDYQLGTLRNDKWVASQVHPSRRRDELSWAHHYDVADLEPEEQDVLLQDAVDNQWTEREMRRHKRMYKRRLLGTGEIEIPEEFIGKAIYVPVVFTCSECDKMAVLSYIRTHGDTMEVDYDAMYICDYGCGNTTVMKCVVMKT